MIKFLNEAVRLEFHKLPLEKQQEINEMAEGLKGQTLEVCFVDSRNPNELEVIVRICAE